MKEFSFLLTTDSSEGRKGGYQFHFLPECIAFNHVFYQNALHLTGVHCATFLPECIATGTTQMKTRRRACMGRCPDSEYSLWQIFYSTVRDLNKFKTRRGLSDE